MYHKHAVQPYRWLAARLDGAAKRRFDSRLPKRLKPHSRAWVHRDLTTLGRDSIVL